MLVPGKTVQGFQIRATQPSEVYAEWKQYPYVDFNGYPRGFVIRYKKHGDTAFKEVVAAYGSFSDTIKGLKPFSFYTFEILAFTNVGRGPPVSKVAKTLEGGKTIFKMQIIFCIFQNSISGPKALHNLS